MIIEYYCKILGIYNNLTITNHIDLECLVYHYFTRHHKIKKHWKNWYIIVIHPSRPGSILLALLVQQPIFSMLSIKLEKCLASIVN